MKRRDTIVRYTAPERINHWVTAFCFVLAAVSGLGFFFPSFNWLMQIMGTPQLARILHPFVGVIMFASFIIMFFRYWHHNLINRDDIFWAKNIRKIVVNEEVGDTGRYNFGQKCVFWAAIIFLVLLLVSGVIIWRPYFAPAFYIPVIRFALMLLTRHRTGLDYSLNHTDSNMRSHPAFEFPPNFVANFKFIHNI